MENQHRKISGYRELNEKELINKVKQLGVEINFVLNEIHGHCGEQMQKAKNTPGKEGTAEEERLYDAQPPRWLAIAKTHFQEGIMAAVRAIAQPTDF